MKVLKFLLVCAISCGCIDVVSADVDTRIDTTVERDAARLGYKIGNGTSFFNRRRDTEFSIEAPTIKWNLSANCSGWDAGLSVSNILDDVEGQFQKMQVAVVNSITGFVTQLPLLLIQREDPALYEMLTNTVIAGEDLFNLKIKSCESMAERFSNSDNPWGELSDESFWYSFSSSFSSETKDDTDVVEKLDEADEVKGENGVVKLGGDANCGGADQQACSPVIDVVKNGLEKAFKAALSGDDNDVYDEYDVSLKPWVAQIWEDADSAEDWIIRVIGDVQYATCEDCEQMEVTAGEGVYSDIADEAGDIYSVLLELSENTDIPSKGVLLSLSSNDVFIDVPVINALRAEKGLRELFIRRISEDIALMRVVDKLLASRRVLLTGAADSYFQSVSMNKDIIKEKIDLISDEVTLLAEELNLKKLSRGDAIEMLLSRHESRNRIGEPTISQEDVLELKKMIERVN